MPRDHHFANAVAPASIAAILFGVRQRVIWFSWSRSPRSESPRVSSCTGLRNTSMSYTAPSEGSNLNVAHTRTPRVMHRYRTRTQSAGPGAHGCSLVHGLTPLLGHSVLGQ